MFTIQNCHLSLSNRPGGHCSYLHQHTTSVTVLHFELHDTSMGHAHLVCIHILFFLPRERFGSHSFPSPSDGSLLQFLSTLFITMALSVEETLMYFGYTYAPNLTHQGASVITEISSATLHANGYRNTTMPTTISSPAAPKCISKGKNYTIGKKLTCANSLKEACAQCVGQRSP
jgi:hypothetical protein